MPNHLEKRNARRLQIFSASHLSGVVFLSDTPDVVHLSQAIAHEFHHNELYMLMEVEELYDDSQSSRQFYSPWKPEPRPLWALLHALHTFAGIVDLAKRLEAMHLLDPAESETNRRRRRIFCHRLRIGLAQVPVSQLTRLGTTVVDDIERCLLEQAEELALSHDEMPPEQIAAIEEWCLRYPDLSSTVRWSKQWKWPIALPVRESSKRPNTSGQGHGDRALHV